MANLRWAGVEVECSRCAADDKGLYHLWPSDANGYYELLCGDCHRDRLELEKRRAVESLDVKLLTDKVQ